MWGIRDVVGDSLLMNIACEYSTEQGKREEWRESECMSVCVREREKEREREGEGEGGSVRDR